MPACVQDETVRRPRQLNPRPELAADEPIPETAFRGSVGPRPVDRFLATRRFACYQLSWPRN